MWAFRAANLLAAVERCYELKSAKGIEDMVAFSFNTAGITPKFGGGGGLPIGKHPVIIYNTKLEATQSGTGGKMVLQCEVIDGPMKGAKGDENLTLQHSNPTVVRISSEQLTAICHVVGMPNGIQNDTSELHNKPFVVEVAPQKDKPEYTEIVGVFDMNGNEPGQQGAGGGQQQQNNAFGGGQQNNAGGGNAGAPGGWGAGGNAGQGQQDPNAGQNGGQGGNGGGWQQQGGGAANQGGGGWGAR
jgi:hypothetical protein